MFAPWPWVEQEAADTRPLFAPLLFSRPPARGATLSYTIFTEGATFPLDNA